MYRYTMYFNWSVHSTPGTVVAIWQHNARGVPHVVEAELYDEAGEFRGVWPRYSMDRAVIREIENAIRDRYPHRQPTTDRLRQQEL
jgi:hypothetical protein